MSIHIRSILVDLISHDLKPHGFSYVDNGRFVSFYHDVADIQHIIDISFIERENIYSVHIFAGIRHKIVEELVFGIELAKNSATLSLNISEMEAKYWEQLLLKDINDVQIVHSTIIKIANEVILPSFITYSTLEMMLERLSKIDSYIVLRDAQRAIAAAYLTGDKQYFESLSQNFTDRMGNENWDEGRISKFLEFCQKLKSNWS